MNTTPTQPLRLSIIAAVSENGVIGNDLDIPWKAHGEQLLFKALTYNQWVIVGRKTFEAMGVLPHRKIAVISKKPGPAPTDELKYFPSIDHALHALSRLTNHVVIGGGGQIYQSVIGKTDVLHISTIHTTFQGNILFPKIPAHFKRVFSQSFTSNYNYTYSIWLAGEAS